MLTFATKKLSTGAKRTKGGWNFPFCPRSFDQAVMEIMHIMQKNHAHDAEMIHTSFMLIMCIIMQPQFADAERGDPTLSESPGGKGPVAPSRCSARPIVTGRATRIGGVHPFVLLARLGCAAASFATSKGLLVYSALGRRRCGRPGWGPAAPLR